MIAVLGRALAAAVALLLVASSLVLSPSASLAEENGGAGEAAVASLAGAEGAEQPAGAEQPTGTEQPEGAEGEGSAEPVGPPSEDGAQPRDPAVETPENGDAASVDPAAEAQLDPAPATDSETSPQASEQASAQQQSEAVRQSRAAQAEIPLPDGQKEEPAPASKKKLVLDNGHIDAFTPVIRSNALRLMLKEDVTALNVLRETDSVIMHVKERALATIPRNFAPSGVPERAYYLPHVQDHQLIWPGWETQLIREEYPGANTGIVVSEVDGPGEVFLWTPGDDGPNSLMDRGAFKLPGTIRQPYPAHTHAAWAFTKPGTYTLTARADVSATNGRTGKTQTTEYTFVVGDLEAHKQRTSVTFEASDTELDEGEAALFTARVTPTGAVGAVQFRDTTTGTVLGHTPVSNGEARFRADALTAGAHRIRAEFVPTWSDDFSASRTEELTITVAGEEHLKPEHDDTTPVTAAERDAVQAAIAVRITTSGKKTQRGGSLRVEATDRAAHAGRWLSVWLPGHEPGGAVNGWYGWVRADARGAFTVDIDAKAPVGKNQQLLVRDADGSFIGWDRFEVTKPSTGGGGGGTTKPGNNGGGKKPPAKQAAKQDCRPPVTLDHGHIDAFNVSAANGKAVLQLKEDVTGHQVIREAETVLLRVKESAKGRASGPAGSPSSGYVLPLAQNQSLIWPGWDTNRTTASGYTDVTIRIKDVAGPGSVHLYSRDSFGRPKTLLQGGGHRLPGSIREAKPAHTHAQWVFTQKGVYKLTVDAVATNPSSGRSITTATHTYVFQVGDVPLGDAFCGVTPHAAADGAAVQAAVAAAAEEALEEENGKSDSAKNADAKKRKQRAAAAQDQEEGVGALLDEWLGGDGSNSTLLAGLLGLGGGLMISGIAGGTIWYVLRLRRVVPGAASAIPV